MSQKTNKLGGAQPHDTWSYATDYLLATRDPNLIESHGLDLLCRSLSTGRTCGFVGSGLSKPYGRLGWTELYKIQKRRVAGLYEILRGVLQEKPKSMPMEIERMYSNFNRLEFESGDIEVGFQIMENLHDLLLRRLGIEVSSNLKLILEPILTKSLRTHTMELLQDDGGHAFFLLVTAISHASTDELLLALDLEESDFLKEKNAKLILAEAWLIREMAKQRLYFIELRHLYSFDNLEELALYFAAEEATAVKELFAVLISGSTGGESSDRPLPPTQRYLLSGLLGLSEPTKILRFVRDGLHKVADRRKENPDRRRTRADYIAEFNDPLMLLHKRLKINRYLTTNYDHEIDRMLRDAGLHQNEGTDTNIDPDSPEPDLLARGFDLIDFKPDEVASLIAFTASDRSHSSAVVHLHGRAEATGQIVVTEKDYRERYAMSSAERG
jgi:SIR2-like domain